MSDLPAGWTETTIGEINTYKSKSLNPLNFGEETFELYSVPSFPQDAPEVLQGSEIGSSKQVVQPEDVLICKINPRINRVWKVKPSGKHKQIASSEWIVVRAPAFHSGYLKHYFSSPLIRERIVMDVTGVGGSLTRAQPKRVAKFPVPVAPLDEQKRIAEKLDTLLTRVDSCERHLERVPHILKRFRQSVLAAATSGRLLENVTVNDDGELPNGWNWVKAEEVCDFITKGTTPKSDKLFAGSGEVPFIKVYNLTFDGSLDFSINPTFVSNETHKGELARSIVLPDDVLMNIVGPPLGKVSIVPNTHPEWNMNQAIARFRPLENCNSKYLAYVLMSNATLQWATRRAKATAGQFNLTLEICRELPVPLPPLEEQAEIVRQVESLFAVAERLEARYLSASERVARLTPSLLAKGFRGELVEQEAGVSPRRDCWRRLGR